MKFNFKLEPGYPTPDDILLEQFTPQSGVRCLASRFRPQD